jgi:drug/metabolite transporter (DMT)-like permease
MNATPHPERARAAGALAVLSLLWGYNWVAMKAGLAHASPFGIASWRFLFGAISLLPVLVWMRRPLGVPRSEWWLVAAMSVLLVLNFGSCFTALGMAGTGKTAVLVYTMPFWTVVLARIFLRERMRPAQWLAVTLAGAGLLVLVDPMHLRGLAASLIAVGAGLFWGASVVLVKAQQGRVRTHVLTLTFWQMLAGCATLFCLNEMLGLRETEWTPAFVGALAYTSVLASTVAWLLFYYALERLPAGMAGLGTLATPVLGVLFAWLVFDEVPSREEAAGMVLIGIGLVLLAVPPRNRPV